MPPRAQVPRMDRLLIPFDAKGKNLRDRLFTFSRGCPERPIPAETVWSISANDQDSVLPLFHPKASVRRDGGREALFEVDAKAILLCHLRRMRGRDRET